MNTKYNILILGLFLGTLSLTKIEALKLNED